MTDLEFYFDPVCPFAWLTSKWVRRVVERRAYAVGWRFISLRMVNADVDYTSHFPPGYEAGHTAGLRLLRVAARVRAEHGDASVARLYESYGERIFDTPVRDPADTTGERRGSREFVEPMLARAELPAELADALDDTSFDELIRAETEQALTLTGRDVGTPIIHFRPPDGVAFFGPVISRLPSPEDSVRLWDHVVELAAFPGFAELKRSLRETPQLAALGVAADAVGAEEDWHGGSRKRST
ncbi:MAG TPA: hypothetical protein VJX10_08020 [Pseudonocardiaceae bacterium]|nr:hypothetical protein [Pseudonocardiaceae bacterium]